MDAHRSGSRTNARGRRLRSALLAVAVFGSAAAVASYTDAAARPCHQHHHVCPTTTTSTSSSTSSTSSTSTSTSTTSTTVATTTTITGTTWPRLGGSVPGEAVNRPDAARWAELDQWKAVGAQYIRFDVPAAQFNTIRYQSDVAARGMESLMIVGGTFTPSTYTPAAFASTAASIVAYFAPLGVRMYELGNEPNLHGFDAATYAALVNAAYPAMKAAALAVGVPIRVLAGAVASDPADLAFKGFITPLVPLIAHNYDVFSFHCSDDITVTPKQWWELYDWVFPPPPNGTVTLRGLMDAAGDTDKLIGISEYDLPPVPKYTEAGQATALQHTLAESNSTMALIDVFTMVSWLSGGQDFGMLRPDGSQRPAWAVYRAAA